jgi:hypothetical protein
MKSDHQLKSKIGEIQQTNITYAFTSNLVPHAFGELHFAGHEHEYMGTTHQKELSNS